MGLKTNYKKRYTNKNGGKMTMTLKSTKKTGIQIVSGRKTNGKKLYRVTVTKTSNSASPNKVFGIKGTAQNKQNLKNGAIVRQWKRKGKTLKVYTRQKSNGKFHHMMITSKSTGTKSSSLFRYRK